MMKNLKFSLIVFLALLIVFLTSQSTGEEKEVESQSIGHEEIIYLPHRNFKPAYRWKEITVEATAYCSCNKCTPGKGITASGKLPSRGTIAAPKHIPFGTVIKLDKLGEFVVQDRGGGIKGKDGIIYIDVWMESHQEALKFGRKKNLKGWIKVD